MGEIEGIRRAVNPPQPGAKSRGSKYLSASIDSSGV